jgi:hypothetical protein
MTRLELRWAEDLLAAFAPAGGAGLAPQEGEVRYAAVLERMREQATPLAAVGLRLALWMAALSPLWLWGRLRTASRLTPGERPELLRQLLRHRSHAVRELTTLLKLVAMMALLGTESVRARSGYDNVQSQAQVESGVRVRLPLLHAPARVSHGRTAEASAGASATEGEADRSTPRAVRS